MNIEVTVACHRTVNSSGGIKFVISITPCFGQCATPYRVSWPYPLHVANVLLCRLLDLLRLPLPRSRCLSSLPSTRFLSRSSFCLVLVLLDRCTAPARPVARTLHTFPPPPSSPCRSLFALLFNYLFWGAGNSFMIQL